MVFLTGNTPLQLCIVVLWDSLTLTESSCEKFCSS